MWPHWGVDPNSAELVTTDEGNSNVGPDVRGSKRHVFLGALEPEAFDLPYCIVDTKCSSQGIDLSLLGISSQIPHCASHTGSSGFSMVPRNLFVVTRHVSSFPSCVATTVIFVSQQSQLVDISRPEFLLRKP